MISENINMSDLAEITDFSTARPNPYAEKIKKHGYSVTIHYSAQDVARMTQNSVDIMKNLDMLELDPDEIAAFEKYRKANGV
jgi:hypothetical protein